MSCEELIRSSVSTVASQRDFEILAGGPKTFDSPKQEIEIPEEEKCVRKLERR